jgi:hypothetical protein
MSYELQVHALSPVRPTPRELLARAGESGLGIEMAPATGAARRDDETSWTRLLLRATDAEKGGFVIEVATEEERARVRDQFAQDRAAGEGVPDQVLDAPSIYALELDAEAPGGEDHQAAFVIAAWALASLTEGIVFDPQEEFFADADSFWAILMDEESGDAIDDEDPDDDDSDDDDSDDEQPVVHRLTVLPSPSTTPTDDATGEEP